MIPDIRSKTLLCTSDSRSHHSLNIVSSTTSTSTSKVSSLSHHVLSHSVMSLHLSSNTSVVPSPPVAEVTPLESPSTKVPLAPDCEFLLSVVLFTWMNSVVC